MGNFKYHSDGEVPKNGEIFVFGSNLAGVHGAGAAKEAMENFGATYGLGLGIQGQSYAIPTKDCNIHTMSLNIIELCINQFIEYAKNSKKVFWVTRVGCGLAGYSDGDIAPMFKNAPENCIMPKPWKQHLEEHVLRNELKTALSSNVVRVGFTKVNGDIRVINCTLDSSRIDSEYDVLYNKNARKINDKVLAVWCVDLKEWRSFKIENVINYEVIYDSN